MIGTRIHHYLIASTPIPPPGESKARLDARKALFRDHYRSVMVQGHLVTKRDLVRARRLAKVVCGRWPPPRPMVDHPSKFVAAARLKLRQMTVGCWETLHSALTTPSTGLPSPIQARETLRLALRYVMGKSHPIRLEGRRYLRLLQGRRSLNKLRKVATPTADALSLFHPQDRAVIVATFTLLAKREVATALRAHLTEVRTLTSTASNPSLKVTTLIGEIYQTFPQAEPFIRRVWPSAMPLPSPSYCLHVSTHKPTLIEAQQLIDSINHCTTVHDTKATFLKLYQLYLLLKEDLGGDAELLLGRALPKHLHLVDLKRMATDPHLDERVTRLSKLVESALAERSPLAQSIRLYEALSKAETYWGPYIGYQLLSFDDAFLAAFFMPAWWLRDILPHLNVLGQPTTNEAALKYNNLPPPIKKEVKDLVGDLCLSKISGRNYSSVIRMTRSFLATYATLKSLARDDTLEICQLVNETAEARERRAEAARQRKPIGSEPTLPGYTENFISQLEQLCCCLENPSKPHPPSIEDLLNLFSPSSQRMIRERLGL